MSIEGAAACQSLVGLHGRSNLTVKNSWMKS